MRKNKKIKIKQNKKRELWVQILNKHSVSQGFLVALKWKVMQSVTKKP